eukprot:987110-Pelagomonas_calceolata.AAC.1
MKSMSGVDNSCQSLDARWVVAATRVEKGSGFRAEFKHNKDSHALFEESFDFGRHPYPEGFKGYKGYKKKRPQSRRLTASLFINTHE